MKSASTCCLRKEIRLLDLEDLLGETREARVFQVTATEMLASVSVFLLSDSESSSPHTSEV